MSDLHVICSCPEPDAYPFGCCCLNLDIISPEMHAVARDEPLIVNGQARPYNREELLTSWRCAQASNSGRRPSIRGVVRGAIGVARAFAGVGAADRLTVKSRYASCLACADNDLGQCRVCGCFVAAKVRNRTERCPLGKW